MKTKPAPTHQETATNLTFLETLESRIAPAVLFMGTDGSIKDSAGKAAPTDPTNSIVGAEKALLLKSGDRLVLDADNNHVAGKTEQTLFSVSKGAAVLYLNNLPDGLPIDIDGVAITGAFKGLSGTDIFGDIATVLASKGTGKAQAYSLAQSGQALSLVPGTGIDGLTVYGFVDGSIVSGGSISKININGVPNDGLSVVGLRAGTGANDLNNLDLGGKVPLSLADFTPAAGAAGAGIQDVELIRTSIIAAGDGGSGAVSAGAGGGIANITIHNQTGHDLTLISGAGGSPDGGKSGIGKAGGNISQVDIQGVANDLTILTGIGGSGDSASDAGAGGSGAAGGSLLDVSATIGGKLNITTGAGGDAGTPFSDQIVNKPGGAGGFIDGLSISSVATAGVTIQLGDSGAGGGKVSGGSIHSSTFHGEVSDLAIIAGNGGDSIQGLSGASGGSIDGLVIDAKVSGTLKLVAGDGGATSAIFDSNLGNLKTVGSGGDGGQIHYSFSGLGSISEHEIVGNLYLKTGDAGSGASVGTAGKAFGFSSTPFQFFAAAATGEVTIITGNGADGAKFASSGGNVEGVGIYGSKISIITGEGGAAGAIDTFKGDSQISRTAYTNAGNGGFIYGLEFQGAPQAISLITGAGGDASSAVSWKYDPAKGKMTLLNVMDGGDAGYVKGISILPEVSLAQSLTDFAISTGTNVNNAPHAGGGDGGQQDSAINASAGFRQSKPTGFGGDGGNISGVSGAENAAVNGRVSFTTGDGGKSGNMLFNLKSKFGPGPNGGAAGDITDITLNGLAGSSLEMTAGNGGSGLGSARSGGGFDHVALYGIFDSVALTTGDGAVGGAMGFPGSESAGGTAGGRGGSFDYSSINATVGSLALTGGNGGAAAEGSVMPGGDGASIEPSMGLSTGTFGDVAIKAGDGGNAGSGLGGISGGNLQGWGGRGGHVSSLDLKVSGQVNLEAGAEGQAGPSRDPNVNGGFIVGSGGEIRDITFHANGDSADVTIVSGDGHDEANATWAGSTAYPNYGTAGYGGSISGIKFAEGTFAGVTLQSGKGGDGAISGGSGGSVTGISLAAAASVDSFVIKGGDGGDGVAGGPADGTKPGDGGNGSGASLSLLGTITSLVIEGGDGGDSLTGIGSGGWGESIGQFAAIIASGGSLQLKAGDGGSSGGTPHSNTFAGHGGWIQGIVVAGALPNTLISSIVLQGGLGGDGAAYDSLSGYHGTGDGGSISHFDSSGLVSESIDIFAGDGGDALKAESGGEGGSLTDITAVYSNTSTASVGSGGIGIAHGKDGTQTNVVLTDATP